MMTAKMTAQNERTAKIALIDFYNKEEKNFWRKAFFNIAVKWRQIGRVREYDVLYCEIPWSEKEFVEFTLEKQRQILQKILKNGKKQGCVTAGLPMKWRIVIADSSILEIPAAKELSLQKAIYDLAAAAHGLRGRRIAVFGVEDRFAKFAADSLLAAGAEIMLNGRKAKSLAEWYYRNTSLAVPVFRTEKAGETADAVLSLNGVSVKKYEKQTVVCGDVPVKVNGFWQEPFADGKFKCGLAVALAAAGGEIADIYRESGEFEKSADCSAV